MQAAFEDALAGRCRGLLLGGAPGVGKTALVDELRPLATARDGWFVTGKFDLYRRDLEFDGVRQALRALGRLLLAEPEAALAEVRDRILRAEGSNVQLLSALLPEFAALLRVPPDPGDPLTAQARAQRAAVTVLRAIASDARPLVVFLDDLQWAGPTPLGVVDMLLSEEPVAGLFVVGAYRDVEADAAHPLAALLSRWRAEAAVRHLHLENLRAPSIVAMVADMLRVDPAAAADLASAIDGHTSGNPYEVVELLNTLRRAGALTATAAGWRWDDGCRARAPGPVRGGPVRGGERADDAARDPAGRRGDGVPRRARRGRRPADRDRHVGGGGRPGARARPRRGPPGRRARRACRGAVPA